MSRQPNPEPVTRSFLGVRRRVPRGVERDSFYVPERDMAHAGSHLIRLAFVALGDFPEPWSDEVIEQLGITDAQLLEAARALAITVNSVIDKPDPPTALRENGFSALPAGVQLLVYSKLGQVALSAIWSAIRDVQQRGDEPPVQLRELLEDIEAIYKGIYESNNGQPSRIAPVVYDSRGASKSESASNPGTDPPVAD